MHRIDTPTAQIDKFGAGKNGFTNGDPGTGRRATDLNSDMWDAVQEEICNAIEKSGQVLNKEQHDQLYQAINKIVSSKIPDALIRNKNLSDLTDKAIARTNLGLGTAATANIQTSTTDNAAGRLMQVGAFGVGVSNGTVNVLKSVYDIKCSGEYNAMGDGASSPTTGVPSGSGNTKFAVYAGNIYPNQYLVTLTSNIHYYVGFVDTSAKTSSWSKFYNTLNKPSASDVDAVSASQGGAFQKQVQFSQGVRLQNSEYLAGIGYGADSASFDNANLLLKSWYGIGFYSNYPSTGELGVMGYINVRIGRLEMKEQIIPGRYDNFDARYQGKGQAYTKAESDGRYVQNVRVGATGTFIINANKWSEAPVGAFMTGWYFEGNNPGGDSVHYRPVQIYINGGWRTITA